MRRALIALPALALVAGSVGWAATSLAASGTGVYAAWTQAGTGATGAVPGTAFPSMTAAVTDGTISVARSATLTGTTPFGTAYGTSSGSTYLSNGMAAGLSQSVTTLTFSSATPVGTWAFALGDIDAESVTITAANAAGQAVSTSNWFQSSFNSAGATDVPAWNASTETVTGNVLDTSGASAWFKPTAAVRTITLTQRKLSGFPSYQLWLATDTQPVPAATTTATASPSATATPTASATTACRSTDTALVNGSFEEPAIPAGSYRQLLDSAVPGWTTTATDHKIEIWSSGYGGVTSPDGTQFAELNATQESELYQDVTTVPGQELTWSLYHRARGAGATGDTMSVNIGAPSAAPGSVTKFTDALPQGWVLHTGTYVVPAGQTSTRFGFASGPTASGNRSIGNFLDHIFFTRTVCVPAEATRPPVSPTASPTATTTPAATTGPSATPTVSGSPTASPTTTATAPGATPTPTAPSTPATPPANSTIIDISTIPGVTPGSTVTDVAPPTHGRVVIVDPHTIVYTPDPGFTGTEEITITVRDREGHTVTVHEPVSAARTQVVVNWTMPKRLYAGTNVIASRALRTNAGQAADLTVTCTPLTRAKSMDAMQDCQVSRSGGRTVVWVAPGVRVAVHITVSAPAKGDYGRLDLDRTVIAS